MQEDFKLIIQLISISFFVISLSFIFFIIFFYSSKRKQLLLKQEAEIKYLQELSNTKTEIQNETLNHIGRELHDNVGLQLSVAKIHTNLLSKEYPLEKLTEISNLINNSIVDIRAISHSLNADRINTFGLVSALQSEIERTNKLKIINVQANIDTTEQLQIGGDKEIMLYRMVQEFMANTLKYAQANNLNITLDNDSNRLKIMLADDGIGFDQAAVEQGTGLINIRHRASLIGATFAYETEPGNGTQLMITLPKNVMKA